jgi:NADH:ubiquinone oxidoreductase subunit K
VSAFHATFLAAVGLGVMGLYACVARRSFLVVVMGAVTSALGGVLALLAVAAARGDARGVAAALVFLLFVGALVVAAVATALATYRRRGTENLDELTELSG